MTPEEWFQNKMKETFDRIEEEVFVTGGYKLTPKERAEYERVEREEAANGNYEHGFAPGSWSWPKEETNK